MLLEIKPGDLVLVGNRVGLFLKKEDIAVFENDYLCEVLMQGARWPRSDTHIELHLINNLKKINP